MKRILSTLVLLTMVMAATAATGTLKICGTSIDLTKNTTGGTGGVSSGSYNYNCQENELTLNNVTITRTVDNNSNNDYGIYSTVSDLVIIFKGTCNISTKASAIFLEGYTTFINKGTVTVTSSNNRAVYIKGGDSGTALQIYGGNWTLTGNHGIEGNKNKDYLRLYDLDASYPLKMNIKGTDGSVIDLKELVIPDGFGIVSTIGDEFEFNSNEHSVCLYDTSTRVKNKNVIIAQKTFRLGGGIWTTWHPDVNYTGRSNISGSGSYPVSYNHSTKTVTLNNATVNGGQGISFFQPFLDGMTINVIGTNTLKLTKNDQNESIHCEKNLTIQGTGTLNLGPLWLYGSDHTLDIKGGVTINVTNNYDTKAGIQGYMTVCVYNSTLNVNANSSANCIEGYVELHGSVVSSPVSIVRLYKYSETTLSSVLDESHQCLFYDLDRETQHKGSIKIVPGTAYNVWVNGVQVNSENKSNMASVLNNAGSSCSYNPNTKTLTLNKAKISYEDGGFSLYPAIYNKIDGLVINNTGTSEIGGNYCGIESEADLTIKGNGHLKVNGTGARNKFGAIKLTKCDLTIDNTELTATGGYYAIFASSIDYTQQKGCVHLNNSYLHLSSTGQAVKVLDFDPNCQVVFPVNGIIKKGYIYEADGKTYAKKVEIEPKKGISTAIDTATPVEEAGETSIYTTSGTLVWQGAGQPQLPRGIYIMKKNGKVQKVQKN